MKVICFFLTIGFLWSNPSLAQVSWVECKGQFTVFDKANPNGKKIQSVLTIVPYAENLDAIPKWKALVGNGSGAFEFKPLTIPRYDIGRQVLDFSYNDNDGSMELAIGIADNKKTSDKKYPHRGDFGIEVRSSLAPTSITGIGIKCSLLNPGRPD